MNRERLLELADVIAPLPYEQKLDVASKPRSFNMSTGCGAACCIGGWTGEIFNGRHVSLREAQKILGLTDDQATALFKPPGYCFMECDGKAAAHVLRLTAAAGDGVTGAQIWAFWKNPWEKMTT